MYNIQIVYMMKQMLQIILVYIACQSFEKIYKIK